MSMQKKITLEIDKDLYQLLEQRFKDDNQSLKKFIIDAIKIQLNSTNSFQDKNSNLKDYLNKGLTGSRTYGIKGQGW